MLWRMALAKYEIVIDGDYSVLRDLLLSLNCSNLKSLDGNKFIVESNGIDQKDADAIDFRKNALDLIKKAEDEFEIGAKTEADLNAIKNETHASIRKANGAVYDEAIRTAESLLERIRASFICSRSSQPYKFEIRSISRITPAGETTTSLNYSMDFSLKIPDGHKESAEKIEHAASWMKLAEKDDNVRHVLDLIANDGLDNLVNIYRVYEVIRLDLGNEKQFREKLGVDKAKLSSFTGSMNSPKTSGHDARHAVFPNDIKIKNPLDLSKANSFILEIIEKWILIKEAE
jgi:hypothetical protein